MLASILDFLAVAPLVLFTVLVVVRLCQRGPP